MTKYEADWYKATDSTNLQNEDTLDHESASMVSIYQKYMNVDGPKRPQQMTFETKLHFFEKPKKRFAF